MNFTFQSIEPRIPVTDLRASVDFYGRLLAFGPGDTMMEAEGFAILRKDKIGLQLVIASSAHPLSPATLWIDVKEVLALHASVKDTFAIDWGPEVYSYGLREFCVMDPDQNRIIFSEPSADSPTCGN